MAIDWRGFHIELLDVAGVLRLFALRFGYAQCAERRAKTRRARCRR